MSPAWADPMRGSLRGRRTLLLVLFLPFAPGAAASAAEPWFVHGSSRVDFNALRQASPDQVSAGVTDGSTNLDGWLDLRGGQGDWEGSLRLRVHQSSGIAGDESSEEIDRRHLAFRHRDFDVLFGNYYTTLGNGILLRTLEQRFVTLNRSDRAFNLDRNLDGVRLRLDRGALRATLLSGSPRTTMLDSGGAGGAVDEKSGDLLQGGEARLEPLGGLEVGFGYILASLRNPLATAWASGNARERMDAVSWRVQGRRDDLVAQFEYVEFRPGEDLRPFAAIDFAYGRGYARYLRLEGATGPVGWSLEGKSYRNLDPALYPYNQPPTLVRTHDSVLLNRATHVLLTDDEQGVQLEALYSPALFTSFILNLATADGHDWSPDRRFREVYVEGRTEIEDRGAARLALDWGRDRIKGVENRVTAALEVESFLPREYSLILDLEMQRVDEGTEDHTNMLAQLSLARATGWTITLTAEHTTDEGVRDATWFFAAVDLRLSEDHDLSLGYGSRPAGIVCSGGFCFESPEFDGAELRLLSRF